MSSSAFMQFIFIFSVAPLPCLAILFDLDDDNALSTHGTQAPVHKLSLNPSMDRIAQVAEAEKHATAQSKEPKDIESRFGYPSLEDVAKANQAERMSIKNWMDEKDLDQSVFGYGMTIHPMEYAPILNADVGSSPIQHDFITWLGARMEKKVEHINYMEIGVAVLKSVHVQSKYFHQASLTCVDIEDPNPTIADRWKNRQILREWTDTSLGNADMRIGNGENSLGLMKARKTSNYIARYDGPNDNTIFYLTGDTFNNFTWSNLAKGISEPHGKMDLILSDGFHSGPSVVEEMNKLIANGVIGNQGNERDFAIVWDDCDGGIHGAVRDKIFPELRKMFAGRISCAGSFRIGGWAGKNENEHGTCVFTTLDIGGPNMKASMSWSPNQLDILCT